MVRLRMMAPKSRTLNLKVSGEAKDDEGLAEA